MKSAIWKKSPVNVSSYGITGSPAGPIDAPIGSVAAEASVGSGCGSVGTPPVDRRRTGIRGRGGVEVVDVSRPVERSTLSSWDSSSWRAPGRGWRRARGVGQVDRLEADAGPVGELLQLDEEARLIAVRGHGLAEHDQLPVVDRERLLCLLARGDRLLGLLELRLELVDVLP